MGDITKIKVNGEPESSYQLYPRNEEFTKRAGDSGTQPDWNQNDVSAPDHVKNRTHWEDPEVLGDIVARYPNFQLSDWDDYRHGEFSLREELVVGDTYKVSIIGGAGRYCVCYRDGFTKYLGNEVSNGFRIADHGAGSGTIDLYYDIYGSPIDLTITHVTTPQKIHKLDPKYLPDADLEIRVNEESPNRPITANNMQITVGSVEGVCAKLANGDVPKVVIRYFRSTSPGYCDYAMVGSVIYMNRYGEYFTFAYIIGNGFSCYLHEVRLHMTGEISSANTPKKLAFESSV